ncbi:CDP-glycerol glycerophosphotransferase family protein, partial [Streptomyces sp. MBT55]|uniref:CDP-glycerol glycerophosphotransferase family protein n=1 Tax=Streptomyces sp. MBT55 TaxID=1488386 RepID=UPI001F26C2C4
VGDQEQPRRPRVVRDVEHAGPGRDAARDPGAAGLLLIADVLVTDYAGLMFDFALTGRPMLFHTYDLEHYRDTVRGFCLDFETRAPGPLLVTTDEVAQTLRDTSTSAARHADAYESFRRDYCDLDDGGAAARVADRLLADAE